MKRVIKKKERPSASRRGLVCRKIFFKTVKRSKRRFTSVNAPYNTSQFLIENNSSPFFYDDDSEIDLLPSSEIKIDESEEIFDDDALIYEKKLSTASTVDENYSLDLHKNKMTSIFT